MPLPPLLILSAAAGFGARLAATFWTSLLIPGLARNKAHEAVIRAALEVNQFPFTGSTIRQFMDDNAYTDPVDFAADVTALFGAAAGGRGPIGRIIIGGGVKSIAAAGSTLAVLFPILLGDPKPAIAGAVNLVAASDQARKDFETVAGEGLQTLQSIADLATDPNPGRVTAVFENVAETVVGTANLVYNWFSGLTGLPRPPDTPVPPPDPRRRAREHGITLPGPPSEFVRLPTVPEVAKPPDLPIEGLKERLEGLQLGRVRVRDPTARRIARAFDLARLPSSLQEELAGAFGL